MNRFIDLYLNEWKTDLYRKPLLVRGARQVGKTFAIRKLGRTYDHFVEINFEDKQEAKIIFEKNLEPERIIRDLNLMFHLDIIPGKTLLFFDEIQEVPKAITALRYFYENMPSLHIIAAGSLLDFAIEKVGVPVGRVSFIYLYPMSWLEFIRADHQNMIITEIMRTDFENPPQDHIHTKLLESLAEYLAIGGMPEAVQKWVETKDPAICSNVHHSILETYQDDFQKYATKHQLNYIHQIFEHIPRELGRKFKYSSVPGEYRKRELAPCLDLLEKAQIVRKIYHSSGQGIPLGSGSNMEHFKILFLDVGLCQALLGLDLAEWFLYPEKALINKGALIENFVGQEILAYSNLSRKMQLYYWQREAHGSEAEIDYLIQKKQFIIPIEVKSGVGRSLKSMHLFLGSHPNSPYGIRLSSQNYSVYDHIHSFPLYAISKIMGKQEIFNF